MGEVVLKIKKGVDVSVFDDGNKKKSYIISFEERHWKVSKLVYYIFVSIDKKGTITAIKENLEKEYEIEIDNQKLEQIIDIAFIKNGLLEGTTATDFRKRNKLLWGRITLLPSSIVNRFKIFSFLFHKKCMIYTGIIIFLWIAYIFYNYSNREIVSTLFSMEMKDLVICYAYVFIGGIIHEFGHSIATMAYDGKPGRIGMGIYIIMPVLFSDVTDAWRLKRIQRMVVDIGGVYLQGVFLVVSFIINVLWLNRDLLNIAILISGFQILGNLNPFIKMDGYWLLVDFLGVTEIKEVLFHTWSNLFYKAIGKPQKYACLDKDKLKVIYIYSVFILFFYLYFIKFFTNSLILAIQRVIHDGKKVWEVGLTGIHFTFESGIQHFSTRITTFIVLLFLVRMIWSILIRMKINDRIKIWRRGDK